MQVEIFVIYTNDGAEERNKDFFNGEMNYDYRFLSKNKIIRLWQLSRIIMSLSYKELIIGGWDSLPMWLSALLSPKSKNSIVVESSYLESTTSGLKGMVKKIFVSKMSKVYASGIAQRKITDSLGFKGQTIITKGVGVFNYVPQPPYVQRESVVNFLYVGRLTACKNLDFLVDTFNGLPQKKLYIVGFGPQEEGLKRKAKDNIYFLGAINNKDLPALYQKMDVFVLPSKSEPWGLVVEEALNNGLPVLVSDRVGCAEEIVRDNENGVVFKWNNKNDLIEKINKISDLNLYNAMRNNISRLDFRKIEQDQVNCYL